MTALAVIGFVMAGDYGRKFNDAKRQQEDLKERVSQQHDEIGSLKMINDSLGVLVVTLRGGFVPCWPRGESHYYFTYDVTVHDGRYQFSVHRDWDGGRHGDIQVPLKLRDVLLDFPKGGTRAQGVARFGRRVANAMVEGTYREGCEFAVTINGEATMDEAGVLRRARFYTAKKK